MWTPLPTVRSSAFGLAPMEGDMLPVRNQFGQQFYQPSDGRQGAYAPQTSYNVPVPRVNPMNQPVGAGGAWSVGMPQGQPMQPQPRIGGFTNNPHAPGRYTFNQNAPGQYSGAQQPSYSDRVQNYYSKFGSDAQRQAYVNASAPWRALGTQGELPSDFGANGQPGTIGNYAQQQVSTVQNPGRMMLGAMPGMMSQGDVMSALGLGDRWREVAGQRNLAALNGWMATEPVNAQMQRMMVAANAGTDQMGLVNQGEQNQDFYNQLMRQRGLNAAQLLWR